MKSETTVVVSDDLDIDSSKDTAGLNSSTNEKTTSVEDTSVVLSGPNHGDSAAVGSDLPPFAGLFIRLQNLFASIPLGWLIAAITLIGLGLRLYELDARAMHHDESLDAWWSYLFRNGRYTGYDPVYHGPLRFYITAGFFEIFGESEATARLFSALSGTFAIPLVWVLRDELKRSGTIFAAVALCISPTMLYYSRFGREDAQMVFLALAGFVVGLSFLKRPRTLTASVLMFVLAASFAIKESTYLYGLLLAIYALILLTCEFDSCYRYARGTCSDRSQIRGSVFTAAFLVASISLTVSVTIGHSADELFASLALAGLAIGGFCALIALPYLKMASWRWPMAHIGACLVALAGLLAGLRFLRSPGRVFNQEGQPLSSAALVGLAFLIAFLCWGYLVATRNSSNDTEPNPDSQQGTGVLQNRRFAIGTVCVAAWLLAIAEWCGIATPAMLVLGIGLICAAFFAMISFRPRPTNPEFVWPPVLSKLASIGWNGWIIAIGTFIVTWLVCFTVFGTRPQDWHTGFTKAVGYWDSQQEVNRGGQPWFYYLFALPVYEWFFMALAAVGTLWSLRRPTVAMGLFIWFSAGSLIIYSYAGERMPWLIAHPLLPMLVLAGLGFKVLFHRKPNTPHKQPQSASRWQKIKAFKDSAKLKPVMVGFVIFGLLATTFTSIRASFPLGADGREILSQAGQATPHFTAALQRYENIDLIKRQHTGEPAILAISTKNAWPASWYLRDNPNVRWFNDESGPPTDGSADVIIANRDTLDPADWPDYQATLFAMRSWWVPTYTQASPLEWFAYMKDREVWAQRPNPNYSSINEIVHDPTKNSLRDKANNLGDGILVASSTWFGWITNNNRLIPAPGSDVPNPNVNGCGAVEQWFLVSNSWASNEFYAYREPIDTMGSLDCASSSFSTS